MSFPVCSTTVESGENRNQFHKISCVFYVVLKNTNLKSSFILFQASSLKSQGKHLKFLRQLDFKMKSHLGYACLS